MEGGGCHFAGMPMVADGSGGGVINREKFVNVLNGWSLILHQVGERIKTYFWSKPKA